MKHPIIITSDGRVERKRDRIFSNPFEMYYGPSINMDELKQRRFNVLKKATNNE